MKSSPVIERALVFGAILTVVIAVGGSIVGFLVAGIPGLASALVATALTAFFMGCTTLSVYIADRATRAKPSVFKYFAIILSVWVVKFVVFVVLLLLVQGQPWLNQYVFFFTLVVAVIGSLIGDIVAVAGAQVSASTGLPPPALNTTN